MCIYFFVVPTIEVLIVDRVTPTIGQRYNLICSVYGVEHFLTPTITYQWTKSNGSITHWARINTDSSILEIPFFRISDTGQYTCQVTLKSLHVEINAADSWNVEARRELNIHTLYTITDYINFFSF